MLGNLRNCWELRFEPVNLAINRNLSYDLLIEKGYKSLLATLAPETAQGLSQQIASSIV